MKLYRGQKIIPKYHLPLLIGICFLLAELIPATLLAAPDVTARYVQSGGTRLVIEINAGANPPASAILVQHLPSGVRILTSQPEAEQYNANRNSAKWLLRNLRAGVSTVSITLDRAVSGGDISAEIRFKSAQSGKMATIQVEK